MPKHIKPVVKGDMIPNRAERLHILSKLLRPVRITLKDDLSEILLSGFLIVFGAMLAIPLIADVIKNITNIIK